MRRYDELVNLLAAALFLMGTYLSQGYLARITSLVLASCKRLGTSPSTYLKVGRLSRLCTSIAITTQVTIIISNIAPSDRAFL